VYSAYKTKQKIYRGRRSWLARDNSAAASVAAAPALSAAAERASPAAPSVGETVVVVLPAGPAPVGGAGGLRCCVGASDVGRAPAGGLQNPQPFVAHLRQANKAF
jgi:hypothetical protein